MKSLFLFCQKIANMSEDSTVKIIFRNESYTKIKTFYLDCFNYQAACKIFEIPENAKSVSVCFTNEQESCGYCYEDEEEVKTTADVDTDMTCMLPFTDLSNSILNLFKKCGYHYVCADLLGGNVAMMDIHEWDLASFIGDIEDFHNWLKPKLDEFFKGFYMRYFCTQNSRINRRRHYIYQNVVKSKSCKKAVFRKKMMKELDLDRRSFIKDGVYDGEYTDREETRRILYLNCIKNYVHRLFLINHYCIP